MLRIGSQPALEYYPTPRGPNGNSRVTFIVLVGDPNRFTTPSGRPIVVKISEGRGVPFKDLPQCGIIEIILDETVMLNNWFGNVAGIYQFHMMRMRCLRPQKVSLVCQYSWNCSIKVIKMEAVGHDNNVSFVSYGVPFGGSFGASSWQYTRTRLMVRNTLTRYILVDYIVLS